MADDYNEVHEDRPSRKLMQEECWNRHSWWMHTLVDWHNPVREREAWEGLMEAEGRYRALLLAQYIPHSIRELHHPGVSPLR